ncbi:hypothetical protein D3875_00700 [Deinococcus cavernae]|uniref:Uncharacterized protein n=2 Tax=Deinococcus cavernae TaxID=2320857 RepID=A0A418VHI8_9DEIO|nr:hypothetical protein D3875_00700 [Deinococcus cavernae]
MPPPVAFTALLHLVELARSVQPEQVVSLEAPRSFARWQRPERQLVELLLEERVSLQQIAQVVWRTEKAIAEFSPQELPRDRLPVSPLRLSDTDLRLLAHWDGEAQRDPMGWQFGQVFPASLLTVTGPPTLRIVQVNGQDDPFEDELLSRTVWNDLAARVVGQGGQVALPFPLGGEDDQKLQVRATLKRILGRNAPLESVIVGQPRRGWTPLVLIDRPASWLLSDIEAVQASTVILVLPQFAGDSQSAPHRNLPLLSFLPVDLRRAGEQREVQQTWDSVRQRWSQRREIEEVVWSGLPNSAGRLARLDWDSIRWLPPQAGEVSGLSVQHAIRAAAWYAAVHGRRPRLEAGLQRHVERMLDGVVLEEEALRRQTERLSAGGNWQDAALLRCWMDALLLDNETAEVVFSTGRLKELAYIGR